MEIARHSLPQVRAGQPSRWDHALQDGEPGCRPLPFGNRHRAVHLVQRRWRDAFEHGVEVDDLLPARLPERWSQTMFGSDARLRVVSGEDLPARRAREPLHADLEAFTIPERPILLLEQQEAPQSIPPRA